MIPLLAEDPSGDPISLLTRNPRLLLVLVAGAAWLFKNLLSAVRARPAVRPGEGGMGGAGAEDEAERTRRVQEEVRRRIAEKRSEWRPAEGEPMDPFEVEIPSSPPEFAAPRPSVGPTPPRRVPIQPQASVQAPVPTQVAKPTLAPAPVPATASAGADLLLEIHNPMQARRAIILREVLGPPVALR